MNTYDVGESVLLRAVFADDNQQPATPSAFTLYIERPGPDGDVDTVAQGDIDVVAVGTLEYADTATAHGLTHYRFEGTLGGRTVIEQGTYWTRAPRAVPAP